MSNEDQIRTLVENWAKAVRKQNLAGILAFHHEGIIMYDVPPPFESKGIDAYKKTWDHFFSGGAKKGVFDIRELHVTAGEDVAFCYAVMQCTEVDMHGKEQPLLFRLTIGFRKTNGQWWFMHEHHSVPAI